MGNPEPGSRSALSSAGCCRTRCSLPCPAMLLHSSPLHVGQAFTAPTLPHHQPLLLPLSPHKQTHCDTQLWSSLLSSVTV